MNTNETDARLDRLDQTDGSHSLKSRAISEYQRRLSHLPECEGSLSTSEVLRIIQELRVHQIELELQNEELQLSQLALEESRSRFKELYDHAPVGYCVVNSKGFIEEGNATLADLLGIAQAKLDGNRFSHFIHKDDQDIFYHLRRNLLASFKPQSCELRICNPDGLAAWVQLFVAILSGQVDSRQDAVDLRVAVINIDARVQAEIAKGQLESQLRESQKMEAIGTLAGGIAHDFNNILTVILVNSELANCLTEATSPATPCIEEIRKAATHARDLVSQILSFCRRQPTDRKVIQLSDVIEESLALLRSTMPARFVLKFTKESKVPCVLADRTQLEQVIVNLATNAMQAMKEKAGEFSIHLDQVPLSSLADSKHRLKREKWVAFDSAVRIRFTDCGSGIPPELLERIFDPFFTTKPVNEGTGLGLAVVHGIIRTHDGEIFVESCVGEGTVFTIFLPPAHLSEIDRERGDRGVSIPMNISGLVPIASETHPKPVTLCNILYVDDDPLVLQSVVRLLALNGVLVFGIADPNVAIDTLRAENSPFEVLVTDYNMPGLSGLDLARLALKICPGLRVVITSGYIDDELRENAQSAGISALVQKPFSAKCFLDVLARVKGTSDSNGPSLER